MFVKLKTQTGALFPFEGREKSTEWVGEENARRINWGRIDWERKATATATASRGNNKAINNKAKCWGGHLGRDLWCGVAKGSHCQQGRQVQGLPTILLSCA